MLRVYIFATLGGLLVALVVVGVAYLAYRWWRKRRGDLDPADINDIALRVIYVYIFPELVISYLTR